MLGSKMCPERGREGQFCKNVSGTAGKGGATNSDTIGPPIQTFNNAKKHGKWTRYYNNGRVFYISNYYLGLKNGSFITFSKNGQYIEKGKYKNNLEDGLWLRFFENGKINYKGKFINGKKTGVWVGYYYNGQLEYKGSFKNGKKDGIWEFYSSNGMKYNEFSGIYKNGNKISKAL